MEANFGFDMDSGPTQTLVTAAANVSDTTQPHASLQVDQSATFGDAGYQGVEKRKEIQSHSVKWQVVWRPDKRRALPNTKTGQLCEQIEKLKASVRAKVKHPVHVVKCQFGFMMVRHRGQALNTAGWHTLFALSNLWVVRKHFLQEMTGQIRPKVLNGRTSERTEPNQTTICRNSQRPIQKSPSYLS
jgi:IS5 family transposase